ncbi:NADH-quinone oxidoreductase subunit L [Dehalococcoidia bacterium]|nr:NADH-quinone oxidoreductase subunit L [Dehalococcoidia bacterium]
MQSMGMEWAWLIPSVCVGAFLGIVFIGRSLPGQGAFLAIVAIAAAFAMFWFVMADQIKDGVGIFERLWFEAGDVDIHLGMAVDELTIVMLGLVTAVALAVQVYSVGYMKGDSRFGWYFAVHSLFAAAMLALVLVDNLLVFYVAWELVGLCSYLLVGFWYERRPAAEAAKKAFVTTRFGDVALLIGILVLFKASGTFDMSDIFAMARAGELTATTLNLSAVLIFIGAAGKSAQFPFHVWLPDAMEGPTPVSALIHAATMVAAGVYLVARMSPLFVAAPGVLDLIAFIGLTTAFVGAALALVQNDIKKVLAYSTISQLGFMMLAMGSLGFTSGMYHLLTHGFFKAALFLGAGSIIHALHGKQDLLDMGGLWKKMPATFLVFCVGGAALVGLFPMSGFFSKDEILVSVMHERGAIWFTAGVVAAGMTALYVVRMVTMAFFGEPRSVAAKEVHESPMVMWLPMVLLLVPAAGLGLLAIRWTEAYEGFAAFLVFAPAAPHGYEIVASVFATSFAVALGGVAVGWFLYNRRGFGTSLVESKMPWLYHFLEKKLYLDDLLQWVTDRVVLAFSSGVALFDRRVVNNAGVDGAGKATVFSGMALRYHETGFVSSYILTIAMSAIAILLIVIIAN